MGKMSVLVEDPTQVVEPDPEPYEDDGCEDMESCGVKARCVLRLNIGTKGDCFIFHEVETPGVWAVDSNSSEEYIREVYRGELDTLRAMLEALGLMVPDTPAWQEGKE